MIIKYLRLSIIWKTKTILEKLVKYLIKSSLQRWIQIYKTSKNLTRKNRKFISYKINKEQVRTAINMIVENELLSSIRGWIIIFYETKI